MSCRFLNIGVHRHKGDIIYCGVRRLGTFAGKKGESGTLFHGSEHGLGPQHAVAGIKEKRYV